MKFIFLLLVLNYAADINQLFIQGECKSLIQELEPSAKGRWKKSGLEFKLPLLAECYIKEGKSDSALKLSENFLKYFKTSVMRDRMLFIKAQARLQRGELLRGVELLYSLIQYSSQGLIHQEVKKQILIVLASNKLSSQELQLLVDRYLFNNELVGELLFKIGEKAKAEKRYKTARYALTRLLGEIPSFSKRNKAQKILDSLPMDDGIPVVLVLAPLTGDMATFGTDVVQGVVLALEQSQRKDISYRIIDTQGEPAISVRRTRTIIQQENVVAIVGPIMSATASAVAAWLSEAYPGIPMITPTATDEGVAELGTNIFQLNLPTSILARTVANYATDCLNHKEFAILTPNTLYGEIMAKVFAQSVEAQGGQIIGVEVYKEGEADYQKNFDILRARKYAQLSEKKRLASGIPLDRPYSDAKARRAFLTDSIVKFDGLFIAAADPADAALLAKQKDFYKIEAQLLGSSGWYGKSTLRSGRKYVENAVFNAPFLENRGDAIWKSFRSAYGKRWNAYPGSDRVAGLSYESAKMIFSQKAPNILKGLQSLRKIKSVYGQMEVSAATGGNEKAHMIQIRNGKFKILNGCPVK
jgi:ABC-type branched-subunit amino acid transport system substrate-binding protein